MRELSSPEFFLLRLNIDLKAKGIVKIYLNSVCFLGGLQRDYKKVKKFSLILHANSTLEAYKYNWLFSMWLTIFQNLKIIISETRWSRIHNLIIKVYLCKSISWIWIIILILGWFISIRWYAFKNWGLLNNLILFLFERNSYAWILKMFWKWGT